MVTAIEPGDSALVVDVLSEAFDAYPVMRFVIGDDAPDYRARLARLIAFFVANRVLRGEPMFGIPGEHGLDAAALASFPHEPAAPAGLEEVRSALWTSLGSDAKRRYDACTAVWATVGVPGPQVHLNMIGVRHARQGQGLASQLLDRVHRLSRETPGSQGVSLTTEHPPNVSLYRHAGYDVVGRARIAPDLETWGFFRHD